MWQMAQKNYGPQESYVQKHGRVNLGLYMLETLLEYPLSIKLWILVMGGL